MKPRNKKDRSWANNDIDNDGGNDNPVETTQADAIMGAYATVKASSAKTSGVEKGADEVEKEEASVVDDSVSDLEWMRRRMASSALETSTASEGAASASVAPAASTSSPSNPSNPRDLKGKKPSSAPGNTDSNTPDEREEGEVERSLTESPRLFLRNLAYSCSVPDLEEAFGKFGELVQVCAG